MFWAVTWSFLLMASVRGKRVFISESGAWQFTVTSEGGSSIFTMCCWIGGRGSWGCKALCSKHCGKGIRILKCRCGHHTHLHCTFLIRDPRSSVWKCFMVPIVCKREQEGEAQNTLVSRTLVTSKTSCKTDPSLAAVTAGDLLEKSLIV